MNASWISEYFVMPFKQRFKKSFQKGRKWSEIHCQPKRNIQGITYVCSDRIFDSPPFMHNKVFLEKLLWKFVAHIFTLFWHLLRPNWSIHRGRVNLWRLFEDRKIAVFEGKMSSISNSSASLNFSKDILLLMNGGLSKNHQYMSMSYLECFFCLAV